MTTKTEPRTRIEAWETFGDLMSKQRGFYLEWAERAKRNKWFDLEESFMHAAMAISMVIVAAELERAKEGVLLD